MVRPLSINESSSYHTSVLILLAAYGLLAAVAVQVDLFYYADGAYFAFAVASGHPWDLLWSDFPRRLGAMGLTGAPAWLAHVAGASPTLVGKIYQATFFAVPVIAMGLVRWLAPPKVAQLWLTWLVISFATLGMSSFGFPTETWVTLMLLWPVIASIAHPPKNGLRRLTAFVLASLFCFSHEAAALCGPALLIAFYRSWQEHDHKARGYLTFLFVWYAINGTIWAALMFGFQPENTLLAKALSENQGHLWTLGFLRLPLVFFGVTMSAASLWFASHPRHLQSRATRIALLAFAASIVLICIAKDAPDHRYVARSAITWMLPVLAMAVVLWRRYQPWKVTQWILWPALIVHTVVPAYAIAGWMSYHEFLVQHTTGLKTVLSGSDWRHAVHQSLPRRAQYYWGWSSPYTSIMAGNSSTRMAMIRDNEGWYVPMTCADARTHLRSLGWVSPDIINLMIEDICTKNPHKEKEKVL